MTLELEWTLEASRIEWSALGNHTPCMAHDIQLALGAFMSSLVVKGRTKSWEAHQRDQQVGEDDSIDIGKSQRLRPEGNARINKMSAMWPALAMIIEKVPISGYVESAEADLHKVENDWCINHANTLLPKRVYWLSERQSLHCSTSDYGSEDSLELYAGVAQAHLPLTGIHPPVASETQNTLDIGHYSQLRMDRRLSSMTWKYWDHFDIGPFGCWRGTELHYIMLLLCTMRCSITWTAWCELWPRGRLHGRMTCSSLWS